ncbi:MAG: histidinol dehydrogenase, partial [bacterium]
MIRRVDLRGKCENLDKGLLQRLVPRASLSIESVMPSVLEIIAKVREGDERSILALGATFDGIAPERVRVPGDVIDRSLRELDLKVKDALLLSIERIKKVHRSPVRGDES